MARSKIFEVDDYTSSFGVSKEGLKSVVSSSASGKFSKKKKVKKTTPKETVIPTREMIEEVVSLLAKGWTPEKIRNTIVDSEGKKMSSAQVKAIYDLVREHLKETGAQ